jgi:methyl-accepting chemotaxis protein
MTELDSRRGNKDPAQELQERLSFLGLDKAARQALRSIKPILDREVPRALEKFYARAQANPQISGYFADQAMIDRAKAAQVEHWRRLSAGEFEGRSLEQMRRIGETHARIGLPPKWYAAGYGVIADHLIMATLTEIWPRGALRGRAFAKRADAGAALGALARVILLDFEIAVSAYIDALDARRHAAEESAARSTRETQAAVEAIRRAVGCLAANNLNCRIDDGLASAFTQLAEDFNDSICRLRDALSGVATTIESLTTATSQIASASQDLSRRTEHEASSIEESSAAIEEVTAQVAQIAEKAQSAQAIVSQAGEEAQQSNEVVAQAISAMQRIEQSSNNIGKIIGAIDEIAFQTNLLALNAGVEAARAGEAGKGFAVVASEVRGLAQRSAEAAKEIKALVAAATSEVASGVQLVSATGEALSRIGAKVADMNAVVGSILASSREQSASLNEIKLAVGELSASTQQNAAMAEQGTAASRSLSRETATLSALIEQFDLAGGVERLEAAVARAPAPRAARVAGGRAPALADWREF